SLSFFRAVRQHALALVAQRQVDGSGNLLANRGMSFDLFTNGLHGGLRPEKAVGQRLVFPQKTQQQVLGLDIRASELAGLIARKEYDPSGFLRVAFKHRPVTPPLILQILRDLLWLKTWSVPDRFH